MSNSGVPSPPLDETKAQLPRKMSKPAKALNRSSKRASPSHDHGSVVLDGRHKRVWKACERCRMKKTKCDGESPCKRCKDDGLVCTAGSRKKTEFKQLPRGYAEVLENTQYALIATVQKLYTMIRNGEPWDLGEPELNDRGQPVIHDIASKLGCIRASPDLPYAFPEGEHDFAELQAHLQSARCELASEDLSKHSEDASAYSPSLLPRTERASSSDSDHSNLSKDYERMLWAQRQVARKPAPLLPTTPAASSPHDNDEVNYRPRPSLDSTSSVPSPIYTDFPSEPPLFRTDSPFSPWLGADDFLGPAHALDLTAHYLRQPGTGTVPRPSPLARLGGSFAHDAEALKAMRVCDGLNFAEGTIRPHMLDCRTGFDVDQMDGIMFSGGDYECQLGMA